MVMAYRTIESNRIARFMAKVEKQESGCWMWTGNKTRNDWRAYGATSLNGNGTTAHRVGYMLLVGDIPESHDLDHLCRNRLCVNPEHLEPVTRSANLRRGHEARGCIRGHSLVDKENISVVTRKDGSKEYRCKQCHVIRNVAAKRRKRAKSMAD